MGKVAFEHKTRRKTFNTLSTEEQIEVYENDILYFLDEWKEQEGIEDLTQISQNRWTACLIYIGKSCFKGHPERLYWSGADKDIEPPEITTKTDRNLNRYTDKVLNDGYHRFDMYKLNCLADLYIELCYKYDKEVSIHGYTKLIHIDYTGFMNRVYNNNSNDYTNNGICSSEYDSSEILKDNYINLCKKLSKEDESSLSSIIVTGKRNPVGSLAKLNSKYGWEERKTVTREQVTIAPPVSREALQAELGGSLEDHGGS